MNDYFVCCLLRCSSEISHVISCLIATRLVLHTWNQVIIVTDEHFVYIYSAIFRHQTDLFYCAHDIGAVVCPFIYHYATHTANGFRAVRLLWNHCAAERTCRFVSRWSGAYFIRSVLCLDVLDASHMSYIVTSINRERDV